MASKGSTINFHRQVFMVYGTSVATGKKNTLHRTEINVSRNPERQMCNI